MAEKKNPTPPEEFPQMTDEQVRLYYRLTKMQRKVALAEVLDEDRIQAYYDGGGTGNKRVANMYTSRLINNNQKCMDFLNSMRNHELAKDIGEIVTKKVLTKTRSLEILSHIAETNNQARNKISAIREIAELQGWHAPTRQQIEVPKGVHHKYTAEDYEKAEQKIKNHFSHLNTDAKCH